MARTKHRHFGDDDNEIDEQLSSVAVNDNLQNIDSTPASGSRSNGKATEGNMSSSDESEDDDAAPEAIQASSAKSIERARLSKLQSAAKQAKQKKEAALKKQKKSTSAKTANTDRKGKGKAIQEDTSNLEEQDLESADEAAEEDITPVPVQAITTRRSHQVFNDEDDEPRPSSSTPRLDPALFQQADLALEQAKERALQEQRQQRQEAALAAAAASSSQRGKKRSRPEAKTSRIVGDIVVQQLAPESKTGEANIDTTSSLISKYNEKFLKDRLFKRKKARLTTKSKNDGNGGQKEEKPFLLFDPLLDKAPKKKAEAKSLTRAEMEERLRFRKSAQTTFSKTQRRSMGPSVAFGSASSRSAK